MQSNELGLTFEEEKKIQPIEVIENFEFSMDRGIYSVPFASEEESWGFLSGSEGTVLCTKNEPIFSHHFVQCAGALLRNKRTGLISIIHQSAWSVAATTILTSQRSDNLDVITIRGPISQLMDFNVIKRDHEKTRVDEVRKELDRMNHPDPWAHPETQMKTNNVGHIFGDRSRIKGLSAEEIGEMFEETEGSAVAGDTNLVGDIKLPVTRKETNRWFLLYRPEENAIWIYDSGAKKLFKYAGFPM